MEQNEIRSAIEAILIASPDPVSPAELSSALDIPQNEIDERIAEIGRNLDQSIGGFMLEQVGGGVRLATRPEFDEQIRRFFSRKRETRMSMAALETLAIVAYRQPITGPEISELRGVNSSGVLRTLLERRMIRIAGRKNVVGSPFLYRTSRDFLLHFGLEGIQDLPKIEEFGEILGEQLNDDLDLGELVEESGASEDQLAGALPVTDSDQTDLSTEPSHWPEESVEHESLEPDDRGEISDGDSASSVAAREDR